MFLLFLVLFPNCRLIHIPLHATNNLDITATRGDMEQLWNGVSQMSEILMNFEDSETRIINNTNVGTDAFENVKSVVLPYIDTIAKTVHVTSPIESAKQPFDNIRKSDSRN